jgi:hypothetical protein
MKTLLRLSLLALCLVILTGCGGKAKTVVKGKVTYKGSGPLPGGSIQFVSVADAKLVGGGTIKPDGTYEASDVPFGECKVIIDNNHLNPNKGMGGMPGAPGMGKAPGDTVSKMGAPPPGITAPGGAAMGAGKHVPIDKSFTSADATPLKSTITSKTATPSDFDVK